MVAIVRSAADFAGADYGLRSIFPERMCSTDHEKEFQEAFDSFVGLHEREHGAVPAERLTFPPGL